MEKEAIKDVQPRGISWAGAADYDLGTVRSEAYFKMTPVRRVREVFLATRGNLQETVAVLNRNIFPDEELYIGPSEIVKVVDWASRHEVVVVQKINGRQKI